VGHDVFISMKLWLRAASGRGHSQRQSRLRGNRGTASLAGWTASARLFRTNPSSFTSTSDRFISSCRGQPRLNLEKRGVNTWA